MRMYVFVASVNPNEYDLATIGQMDFDEAVRFFEKDEVHCCNTYLHIVDLKHPNEFSFHAEEGDTMFTWGKVFE